MALAQYRTMRPTGVWLPWVWGTGDYAGIYGEAVCGLQFKLVSGRQCGYRVAQFSNGMPWLPPVNSVYEPSDYAGVGAPICGVWPGGMQYPGLQMRLHYRDTNSWTAWMTSDYNDYNNYEIYYRRYSYIDGIQFN
ncbi:MAG: hypothetical protein LBK42_10415 [Propionibacteriaceae bacterium]|jgi:hypothetical protein|nr:hypothetical protein [Propionibacteriaceae bacterium]